MVRKQSIEESKTVRIVRTLEKKKNRCKGNSIGTSKGHRRLQELLWTMEDRATKKDTRIREKMQKLLKPHAGSMESVKQIY